MKFNLISYENGRVLKEVEAETLTKAETICQNSGYSLDDEFLEPVEETIKHNKLQTRTRYIDEEY